MERRFPPVLVQAAVRARALARRGASAILTDLVAHVVKRAWIVLGISLALSILAGWGATTLGVNTDTTDMLSRDLPFRKAFTQYSREFPRFRQNLVIVIDGRTVDAAEEAGRKLHQRLLANRSRFRTIFYPQGDPYFRRHGLLYLNIEDLEKLAERITAAQPLIADLNRDPTLRGLFGLLQQTLTQPDKLKQNAALFGPVLDRITEVIDARVAGNPRRLAWGEILQGNTATMSDRRRIIVVQPELDFKSLTPAKKAMDQIRRWAIDLGLTPEAGVRLRLTGSTAINSEELKAVTDGAKLAGWISLVLVSLLLVIGLQSLRLVVGVLVTLIVGLIWTAGFAALAVGTLNLISVAFAVLFIGLGVDFGIHFALRCREERAPDVDRRTAILRATRGVGTGLALSAAAAAAAFLSFLPTEYRGVSELGLIAGAGMGIALLASLTVLPAILALWPERRDLVRLPDWARSQRAADAGEAAQAWFTRNRRPIVGVALVLAVAGVALSPWTTFDRNPLNLKDPSAESVATAVELSAAPGNAGVGISVVAPSLEKAAEIAKAIRGLPSVRSVRTIRSYIPANQQDKLDVIEELSLLMLPVLRPQKRKPPPDQAERVQALTGLIGAIAKALADGKVGALTDRLKRLQAALIRFREEARRQPALWDALSRDLLSRLPARLTSLREALSAGPVAFKDLPRSIRDREISPSGKVRVFVSPKGDLRDPDVLGAFVNQVTGAVPTATGPPVLEHRAGDEVVRAFVTATAIAFLLITLALLALLRRPLDVLLVLTPVLIAGSLTIGITVIFDIPFNFANIIVVPLLIGLGVAAGIHLVMRRRKDGVLSMGSSTPRAVLFSALTTVASFGSLAISPHRGTASMGELLMIAISLTLICALIVLPALAALASDKSGAGGGSVSESQAET